MGQLARLPAQKELLRLVVELDSAEAFLADYDANLSQSSATITTARSIDVGTIIEIGISFPGLLHPIVLDALVRDKLDTGLVIALLAGGSAKLAEIAERVRARDPKLLAPVVNVLIVEDNKHVCELVCQGLAGTARRELKDVTFTFETAADGAAALQLLKTRTFDAAIVDVYLPVLDGPSMIQQARTALGLTDLPIITMSAGGDSARDAALKAGATVFLDKPVRLREVVATMRQLLAM
jgi:CheY-like chemotaxis protein